MLYLIGFGLNNEKDLSLRAVEALRECSKIYAEFYTSPIKVNLENLEKIIGTKVEVLDRKEVEESRKIIESAEKENTAFLVPGDPLSATTHLEIVKEARKMKIEVKIIHSSSIFTAIGESGLSLYRFGRIVSLPSPKENYLPESPFENINKNLENNLHTLLLLDIGMKANEGLKLLKKKFSDDLRVIIVAHLGKNSLIKYGKIKALINEDFGELPHSIIIPTKLEFYEKEFVEEFKC